MRGLASQILRGGAEGIGLLALLLGVAAVAALGAGILVTGCLALLVVLAAAHVEKSWQVECLLVALAIAVTGIALAGLFP